MRSTPLIHTGRRSAILLVSAALVLAFVPAPGRAGPEAALQPGPVRWAHLDEAYLTESALADLNGDGVPDVITGAGDRNIWLWFLFPPGNPVAGVSQMKREVRQPAAGLRALDGATGEVLWEVPWQPETTLEWRNTFDFLDALELADLDGDGKDELLVLRASYRVEETKSVGMTYRITAYQPGTGRVLWERRERFGPDRYATRRLRLMRSRGRSFAFVTSLEATGASLPRTRVELLGFGRKGPARSLWRLPPRRGWMFTDGTGGSDGLRLYLSRFDTVPGDGYFEIHRAEVEALLFPAPSARPITLWRRRASAGNPIVAFGGRQPGVLVGDEGLRALDAQTGRERWRAGGLLAPGVIEPVDINRDGYQDMVVSPAYGSTLGEGDPTTEFVALDGRTGSELWRRLEPLGKFGAWSLQFDRTANAPRLIATMMQQDGFAFAAQFDDDPGLIGIYDLLTGERLCRFPTDHIARRAFLHEGNGTSGSVLAPTVGGSTYAFAMEEPACGVGALGP